MKSIKLSIIYKYTEKYSLKHKMMRDQYTQTQQNLIRNREFFNLTLRDVLIFIFSLLLPLMLGVYTAVNTIQQQMKSEKQFAEDRLTAELQRDLERNLTEERYQNEIFDTYIKEMGVLMNENNGTLTSNFIVSTLARSKTLHVFRRLDSSRNIQIIRYLHEAEQLSSLDLSTAKFHHIDFRQSAINENYLNSFSLTSVFLFDSIVCLSRSDQCKDFHLSIDNCRTNDSTNIVDHSNATHRNSIRTNEIFTSNLSQSTKTFDEFKCSTTVEFNQFAFNSSEFAATDRWSMSNKFLS